MARSSTVRSFPHRRAPGVAARRLLLMGALVASASCAGRRVVVARPALDPQQAALALEERTRLRGARRIVFGWELNERGMRVQGKGVARVEAPYRARLDLFLRSGDPVVSAALVDGSLRLPPGAPAHILPPADLMWGTLGVFRPEYGTELVGGDELEGGGLVLRYRIGDGRELHYRVRDGRLAGVELLDGGHVTQRIELEYDAGADVPRHAVYRNLAEFRELKMTAERVDTVEPFPPDIWNPTWREGR